MNNTQKLVTTAMLLALGTVLSLIKIYEMPMGGSVTLLSMLPIAMISICFGLKHGLLSAFLYSIIQLSFGFSDLLSWGLTPQVLVGSVFLDYIIPFTAIGIAGLFRNSGASGICKGIALGLVIRFASHVVSGIILFSTWAPEGWSPEIYSIAYNGSFMMPELIFTMVGAVVLFKTPQVRNLISAKSNQNA